MCSLHARAARAFNAIFEEIRAVATTELSDDNLFRLKATKQKAIDEFLSLKGCAVSEKYLKVLNMPTPPKKNLTMLQAHLDELTKTLR